ncbi:hypothetical protein, partial [Bradyrhizobium sp. HKCCYLRH3061]|uniref:hypothetical protein n=1 Tax=Bradyrhizobium sp. HKCCYLRH3061 TaxID=3420734 RepID=UPI003EBA8D7D
EESTPCTMSSLSEPDSRGLVPGIHVVLRMPSDVDGRDKPGHDDLERGERSTPIVSSDCPPRGDWAARAAGVFVLSATCPQ